MKNIIPRWEWRTFGDHFGDAEVSIKAHVAGKTRESSEIYILSEVGDDNTKIRDMLMDIKTLQQVNAYRLEQWKPIMKAAFPLPAEQIKTVFSRFRLALPKLKRKAYTDEQFIEELIKPQPLLRAVNVKKKRATYTIYDCIVEIAEITADGKPSRTIGVEMEDPEVVIAAVRRLALERFENINYPKGLKQILGMKS